MNTSQSYGAINSETPDFLKAIAACSRTAVALPGGIIPGNEGFCLSCAHSPKVAFVFKSDYLPRIEGDPCFRKAGDPALSIL
jgi:hypothetical protein